MSWHSMTTFGLKRSPEEWTRLGVRNPQLMPSRPCIAEKSVFSARRFTSCMLRKRLPNPNLATYKFAQVTFWSKHRVERTRLNLPRTCCTEVRAISCFVLEPVALAA